MLCVYDLYDLHSVFVNIRFSPLNPSNEKIMSAVISVLQNKSVDNEFNQFRKALRKIHISSQEDLYKFICVDNYYCYQPLPFLKDENIYQLLTESCRQLLQVIHQKCEKQIYDLADCLHNLPILLAENKYSIPCEYWKNEVSSYRNKWDTTFLVKEQHLLLLT